MNLLVVLALLVCLMSLTVGLRTVLQRVYSLDTMEDENHWFWTNDGWRIGMSRYRPRGPALRNYPVLLVHGFQAHRSDLDFDEQLSLARYLANRGFDCWSLDLRGRGLSRRPRKILAPRDDWALEDLVANDCSGAIQTILQRTGKPRLHWVGHSLGGQLSYVYLAQAGNENHVASCVTLGSAPNFDNRGGADDPFGLFMRRVRPLAYPVGRLSIAWLSALFAPAISNRIQIPPMSYLAEFANMSSLSLRRVVTQMIVDEPATISRQFLNWYYQGGFRGIDGAVDHFARMERITTPMMFMVGAKDRVILPSNVEAGYHRVASKQKALVVCGKTNGFMTDYGHGDMTLASSSPTEIYPRINGWFVQFDS